LTCTIERRNKEPAVGLLAFVMAQTLATMAKS